MKHLLSLIFVLAASLSFSQSIDGTITSSGDELSQAGITVSYAAGQPVIITDSEHILFETITTGSTVSVTEHDTGFELTFYPNPTSSFIRTDHDRPLNITIYNITGKQVLQTKQKQIDVSHLPSGHYIITAQSNNQISNFKFIKK